jgi:hypothetical protein
MADTETIIEQTCSAFTSLSSPNTSQPGSGSRRADLSQHERISLRLEQSIITALLPKNGDSGNYDRKLAEKPTLKPLRDCRRIARYSGAKSASVEITAKSMRDGCL